MKGVRLGRVVSLIIERAEKTDFSLGLEGVESRTGRLLETGVAEFEGSGIAFVAGDVLFGKLRPYLAKSWVADRSGAAVGDFHVYRPSSALGADYLGYLLQGEEFLYSAASAVVGAKMPRTTWSFVRNVEVWAPPLPEQRLIADYLDRETAKIDALIGKQERLIETLRERRSAVISQVMLRGLDGAELVDTGNPFLARAPQGWIVSRLSREMLINGGQVDPTSHLWIDSVLVAPNHIEGGTGRIIGRETARTQGADSGKYTVSTGQLMYSKIRPALNKVAIAVEECLCSADMYAMTSRRPAVNRFILYFMLSDPFLNFATHTSMRVKMPKINRVELGEAPWVVPPLEEQQRISEHLDEQTAKIDLLILKAERFIDLAKERRSALITAAVTGQIDVRDGAAKKQEQEPHEMEPV